MVGKRRRGVQYRGSLVTLVANAAETLRDGNQGPTRDEILSMVEATIVGAKKNQLDGAFRSAVEMGVILPYKAERGMVRYDPN